MLIHNSDITGSLTINGIPYNTGSFTGSFFGDGSQLDGVTSYTDADTLAFINSLDVVSGSIQTLSTVSDTFTSVTSYTVTHNFGTKEVIVSVYENDTLIFPSSITTPTTNTVTITFPEEVTGRVVVVKAGHIVSGSINYDSVLNKPTLVSGSSQIADFGIFATTGSNGFNGNQSITGSLTVTGQVVAQTLNVQQVTSSVVFSSGSNVFGNELSNTQQFTGSVGVTGSLTVDGTVYTGGATSASALSGASELIVQNEIGIQSADLTGPFLRMVAGSVNQNFTLVTGAASGSEPNLLFNVGGSTRLTISGSGAATFTGALNGTSAVFSGNVGIGITPSAPLHVVNTSNGFIQRFAGGTSSAITGGIFAEIGRNFASIGTISNHGFHIFTNDNDALSIDSTGSATFSNSITSNYTYNGGVVGMLHLTSNGTEGGSITFEKTSGTTQKYKIGNSGTSLFIYDETGAKQPFTILNNGNVGIGSATSPSAALNVSNVPTSFFGIVETTGTSAGTVKHFRVHKPGYVEYGIGILDTNSFHISTASTFPTTNGFTITSTGNVGIGTTSPSASLDVNGKIRLRDGGNTTIPSLQMNASGTMGLSNPTSEDIVFITTSTERMRITSDGYVTKPYQPAFRAGRNTSYNPGADSNIVFNSVFFNIGSHYNASNGVFTAPIAGRYYFSASVIWESVPDGQEMDDAFTIRANGSVVAYDFRRAEYVAGTTGNGGYYVTNANILLNLAANDNVSIRNNRNLTVHGNPSFSWFVGYLLG